MLSKRSLSKKLDKTIVIIGFAPIKIATKEDGINCAPHEIIENGNENPKNPIKELHNQKFKEIGNFLFKIRKNVNIVILPIISLKDITFRGLIVSNEIFKAAKADPHITTKQKSIA
tara:strand:+ start:541 stop:888 length:348 start_codon:yes stop_codon:yes gene_type:complete